MQFFLNKKNITFLEFAGIFPEEAQILLKYKMQKDIQFHIEKERLILVFENFSPIYIDIKNTLKKHEIYFYKNSMYKDTLARAIGLKKGKKKPIVLDATAGMLGDSLLMYSYGVRELLCCERNPYIAVLIMSAVKNLGEKTFDFFYGQALEKFEQKNIDVVFYDPMYKVTNLKSSPKKEMVIFRKLIGEDQDMVESAKKFRSLAKERLVIKRSNKAPPLLKGVSHTIKGKSTSYDVYLQK